MTPAPSTYHDPPGAGRSAEADKASHLAEELLGDARSRRRRAETRQAARMARLLSGPQGRRVILALTDEVLRIGEDRRAAALFSELVRTGGNLVDDWRAASYFDRFDRLAFLAGGRLAPVWPAAMLPLVRARVRREMAGVTITGGPRRLAAHIRRRGREGVTSNVNFLGEAVLGEDEADRRLQQVIEALGSPHVTYVSVKISAIASQLDVLAYDDELDRLAPRLRRIYRAAVAGGRSKFVNLDMEEYRDLGLTVDVFRRVLDEPEFLATSAGIVLQAYIPDSLGVLEDLAGWAQARRDRGGAEVKVRIVKGANMAMETVEAERHGWPRAPFATKAETDANYKRMLETALRPELAGALKVGVASHNLFEIAWAAVRAEAAGAAGRVGFEMLEGMSSSAAEAVAARFPGVVLYTPVVDRADLPTAIAYLVRRLDENAEPDNYLAHQFALAPGSPAWAAEKCKFLDAVAGADGPAPASRRRQDRSRDEAAPKSAAPSPPSPMDPFANSSDTDFTRAPNRDWIAGHLRRVASGLPEYRPVVHGRATTEAALEVGRDPSRPDRPAYMWAAASEETVGAALEGARVAQPAWAGRPREQRASILLAAATELERRRGRLLAVMAVDSGKTVREGDPEVSEAVDFASYYARSIPDPATGFEPHGTVVVAAPWNFPLSIPAGGVLAALAAGNAVVLKPAPETVAVAAEMVEALWVAGVPHDVLHFVPCVDGETSRLLITSDDVDAVVLTGSWETAQLFLDWRPDLRLHAETSGKNAVVVTATCDPDQAIADIVASAFGHAGQKCSAASLAILEAAVYDDRRFLNRLADAVRSLRVGPAARPATTVGPLIRPPEGPLRRALRELEPGERWLVSPEQMDPAGHLWRPGVKVGVQPGSFLHLTECFGPVLAVMRATDLDQALAWQNQPAYGLTAGLQALDPDEIDHWRARVEAGNLYVNRGITGAVVARQPFGGWKRSVVGPGAKAGGPNYVSSLGSFPPAGGRSGSDFVQAWRAMAAPADFAGLVAEANVFRYRPLGRAALVGSQDRERAEAAARAAGVEVLAVRDPGEAAALGGFDKLRLLDPPRPGDLRAAHGTGIWVDAAPVAADPSVELRHWVREQAVSESRHRHGHVTGRRPGLLPPPGD